jgi:hypothetical protein
MISDEWLSGRLGFCCLGLMAGDWFFFFFWFDFRRLDCCSFGDSWILLVIFWCFGGNFLVMRSTEDFWGIFWIGFHGEGRGRLRRP